MRQINLHFNFTNVPPELVASITQAIEQGQPFGLTNGSVVRYFHPVKLEGWFTGRFSNATFFAYASMMELTDGISLALLTCKEFVPGDKLVVVGGVKNLLD